MITTEDMQKALLIRKDDVVVRTIGSIVNDFVLQETQDGRVVKVPENQFKFRPRDYICEGSEHNCIGFRYK